MIKRFPPQGLSEAEVVALVEANSGATPETKTAGFAAVAGGVYLCNTFAGAFAATLPATAIAGDRIEFIDARNTWATNNLTLDRNGLKLRGLTTNLPCNVAGDWVVIVYQGTDEGWRVLP